MRSAVPNLFELEPKSVIKLFEIINLFIEFDLNKMKTVKDLNSIFDGKNYTIEEKFFFAHYLPKYLDTDNKKNYISKRIKEIEVKGDFEDLDIVNIVKKYSIDLTTECAIKQKSLKRAYNYFIKSNIIVDSKINSAFKEALHWKRLPLDGERKQEFLEFILKQLEDFFTKEEIQLIIENSFDIFPFPNKVCLLHLEMKSSQEIRQAFYHIYTEYKKRGENFKDIADGNEVRRLKPKNQKIINGKYKKADFLPYLDKKEYGKATAKINISKIMFLTFSKIRENYLIDLKTKLKSNESLNLYLITYCRNIKLMRKKYI